MFTDWQKQVLGIKFPFDIQVYHQDPAYDFSAELEVIRNETKIKDFRTYRIWENHTDAVNTWLYTHLRYFGDKYKKADGTPDEKKIAGKNGEEYAPYDTFMALSDYNYLRQMLGYSKVTLGEDEYFVLGDNRNHSQDSRDPSVGEVKKDTIMGKAWVRIYPFDKMGVIRHE